MKKKNALIIAFCFMVFFLIMFWVYYVNKSLTYAEKVEIITPDEKIVWPLHKDAIFDFYFNGDHVEIKILQGTAFFLTSSCPNQTCVESGSISHPGQVVICAPNRVLIRIKSIKQGHRELLITY